ncbi:hypothetical protein QR685DRAFT_331969 [Neurospora intermedia]|uniref:Uncharacterized protein n=1 Tax=Neurospora intermedia TaxID=5142 RepID=A0ABR3D651_NEUIN
MASSSQQSESNNATQNANATIGHNSNDTANNNDSSDKNNKSSNNRNIGKNSQNEAHNEHAPVSINLRSTATASNPVQHIHYESLPALNLNHPPFYGTYRDSTDGVPQYHPFSDDDDDDDDDDDGQELEEENREESENQFSRIHRVDHAYSDRSGRERQQRDEEESDSGRGRRRSRWERRRGVVMKMRKAMIWIVVLPLLLGALWVCINLFRKDETV